MKCRAPCCPLDVQVLDQERRDDHAHPVVHPALRRAAGACRRRRSDSRCALLPGGRTPRVRGVRRSSSPAAAGSTRARSRASGTARARRTRATRAPCRKTSSPGPRSASSVRGWRQPHFRYTDMCEVRSRSGRSRVVGVVGQLLVAVRAPRLQRGVLARRRAASRPAGSARIGGDVGAVEPACQSTRPAIARRRRAPAVRPPRAGERREDLERRAVVLAHAPGRDGVRRAGAHQRHLAERLLDRLVARRPYGPKSALTCTDGRAGFA